MPLMVPPKIDYIDDDACIRPRRPGRHTGKAAGRLGTSAWWTTSGTLRAGYIIMYFAVMVLMMSPSATLVAAAAAPAPRAAAPAGGLSAQRQREMWQLSAAAYSKATGAARNSMLPPGWTSATDSVSNDGQSRGMMIR